MSTPKFFAAALLIPSILFSHIVATAQSNVKKVDFKGNTIGIEQGTVHGPAFQGMVATSSGYKTVQFNALADTIPIMVNNMRVFKGTEVSRFPKLLGQYKDLDDYIFFNLQEKLARLEESNTWKLHINNVVVDTSGKIVYYETSGMHNYAVDDAGHSLWSPDDREQALMAEIKKDADSLLDAAPLFIPAKVEGQPVPYVFDALFRPARMIYVRKNKAYLTPVEPRTYSRPRR